MLPGRTTNSVSIDFNLVDQMEEHFADGCGSAWLGDWHSHVTPGPAVPSRTDCEVWISRARASRVGRSLGFYAGQITRLLRRTDHYSAVGQRYPPNDHRLARRAVERRRPSDPAGRGGRANVAAVACRLNGEPTRDVVAARRGRPCADGSDAGRPRTVCSKRLSTVLLDTATVMAKDLVVTEAPHYAFKHSAADEPRRLELFQTRLDPLTIRRIKRLGIGQGASCLEIGGGHGSITRWLSEWVGPEGRVTATDLQLDFLARIKAPNVEVLRHDIRMDGFPERSFDLIHTRAVLMHIPDDLDLLRRMASWLAPGGWLLLEEPDFGMWLADVDQLWASHPHGWHQTFPSGSLSRGRKLLRQIHQLGLSEVGADAEVDIIQPGTPLAEFYRLSMAAIGPPAVEAGAHTPKQAEALINRTTEPDFLGCGFVHIGVWARRPRDP